MLEELDGEAGLEIFGDTRTKADSENSMGGVLYFINKNQLFRLTPLDSGMNREDRYGVDAFSFLLEPLTKPFEICKIIKAEKLYSVNGKRLKFIDYSYFTDGESVYQFVPREAQQNRAEQDNFIKLFPARHDLGELIRVEKMTPRD